MIGTGVGRALAGATVAVIAAATALAFATIDPPPLKAKTRPGRPAPVAAAPEIVVQEAAAPPPPTAKEFAQAKPAAAPPRSEAEGPVPDLVGVPIGELRSRANHNDVAAMEELGRRLIQGNDVAKDPQAGAGWLLRAAELGSPQSQFNVGVMYERGFVVERDSTKAAAWYRKAADSGLAVAKHNLALLLRDGKGVARDGKAAIDLLEAAARQGMAASMFTLGDIYDRGDAAPRDAVEALVWFAVTAEFDRQLNGGADTTLSRTADQRSQTLQRTLTPEELARAQDRAQGEFKLIVEALTPPAATPPAAAAAETPAAPAASENVAESPAPRPQGPPPKGDPVAWPLGTADQIRAVQQMLVDLKLLRDKPDGSLGPMTRAAIRDFQKSAGLQPTGDVTKDLYLSLRLARNTQDIVANSPLPSPGKVETPPPTVSPPTAPIELVTPEPPPPPTSAELAREFALAEGPKLQLASTAVPKFEPVKVPPPSMAVDPDAWPASRVDQVKLIQSMLRDMKFYTSTVDGIASTGTRTAIRDYEKMAGLKETGEPSKALFESLKEMRALMGGGKH